MPNAPVWLILNMLHLIRQRPWSRAEIMETLGVSRATSARLFTCARNWYGVGIEYDRNTNSYAIDEWGIVDPLGMERWIKKRARKERTK